MTSTPSTSSLLLENEGVGNGAMPVVFVAHGAPTLAVDATKGAELRRWAGTMPRPRAILVISPHWQTRDATIGTVTSAGLGAPRAWAIREPRAHGRKTGPPLKMDP